MKTSRVIYRWTGRDTEDLLRSLSWSSLRPTGWLSSLTIECERPHLLISFHPSIRSPARIALFLIRQITCNRGSILSVRMRWSESTINTSVAKVTVTVAKTVEAEFINMTIICNRAACSTGAPARIAPVIIPGIEIMPIMLQTEPLSEFLEVGATMHTSYGWWSERLPTVKIRWRSVYRLRCAKLQKPAFSLSLHDVRFRNRV